MRFKLLTTILVVFLPALCATLYVSWDHRRHAMNDVLDDAVALVDLAARTFDDTLARTTPPLLKNIATLYPEVRAQDGSAASAVLSRLVAEYPQYINIMAAKVPSGDVYAAGVTLKKPLNLSDRPYFSRVIQSKRYVVGEFALGKATGKPTLVCAYPVLGPQGAVDAVIAAGIDVERLALEVSGVLPRKDLETTLLDRNGTVLLSTGSHASWVGKTLADSEIWSFIQSSKGQAVYRGPCFGEVGKLVAFKSLAGSSGNGDAYVLASMDEAAAVAQAERLMSGNLLGLIISILSALGGVLFIARREVLKDVDALVKAAQRLAEGDLAARTGAAGHTREFARMAETFDLMAEGLLRRETEQKIAEEALRRSEENFRTIFESAPFPLTVTSHLDGSVLYANPKAYDFYEIDPGRTTPVKSVDLYTEPRDREALVAALLRDGSVTGFETCFRTLKGNRRWVAISARMITYNGQQCLFSAQFDITERREAEATLAAEKERLAVTLRSIGDGVIATDNEARIVLFNKVSEELTGWKAEEALGRPLLDVFHIVNANTREVCEDPCRKVLATGQVVGLANHTVLLSRDGGEHSIADSGAPIRDREGHVIGVVLVFRDVTEEEKREEELIKVQKLESLGVLAGGIAHDFNNLLTGILGNLSLAKLRIQPQESVWQYVSKAEDAILRAKDLSHQLLTFSRGGQPIKKVTDVGTLLRTTAEFASHGATVDCLCEIAPDLWAAEVDEGQIAQVINNLVINGVQAMPRGGSLAVRAENIVLRQANSFGLPGGNYLKISVRDNGEGIPEHLLSRIFDPYFTTKSEGSGLGLAICYSIVRKHDGHVAISSTPGSGTIVSVYLPACIAPNDPKPTEAAPSPKGTGRKILIMDDEEELRLIAVELFGALGWEVEAAADGAEALVLYKKAMEEGGRFDLVVTDLTVPGGMGGKEAAARLLELDPTAKLIVSSGYSNDPVMAEWRRYGFAGVLAKPYSVGDIREIAHRVLGRPHPPV